MVVTRNGECTAPSRGARHVGVLEHIGRAVNPRPLPVPDAKHAVKLVGPRWRKTQLLRAPYGGGGQFFIHTRLKNNVACLQVLSSLPQGLVITAERRAAVARYKARRVFALQLVAQLLQHRQLDERLHAAHEGMAVVQTVFVIKRDSF